MHRHSATGSKSSAHRSMSSHRSVLMEAVAQANLIRAVVCCASNHRNRESLKERLGFRAKVMRMLVQVDQVASFFLPLPGSCALNLGEGQH